MIPKLLMAGIIMLIPFSPRWSNYIMILLAVTIMIVFRHERKIFRRPVYLYLLIVMYLVRILWLFLANDLLYGLRTLETELPLLTIPLLFLFFKLTPETKRFLCDAFVLMAFLMILYSFATLFQYINKSEYSIWNYWETHFVTAQYYASLNMLSWSFVNYSFLNLLVIYGLNLLVYRETKSKSHIAFTSVYALFAFLFAFISGSLMGLAILSGCVFLFALIFVFEKWGSRPVLGFLSVVSLLLIFSLAQWDLKKSSLKERLFRLDAQRYPLFAVAWNNAREKPLFGYGTGAQKAILQDMTNGEELGFSKEEYPGLEANHPHNQFLTDLLQFGIIGCIPLLLFYWTALSDSLKHKNWALLLTLLTYLATMMVESPINTNKGVLPFVVLVCILAEQPKKPES